MFFTQASVGASFCVVFPHLGDYTGNTTNNGCNKHIRLYQYHDCNSAFLPPPPYFHVLHAHVPLESVLFMAAKSVHTEFFIVRCTPGNSKIKVQKACACVFMVPSILVLWCLFCHSQF